ncbi:hypothetical protein [Actinoplanes teichomyceticus]|uniref:Uncharacterized protein n=1 Tax=Actinoplanes teichomyceticus TaxID=1867 RepID=A0A561WN49_ACTTI|nr:hypothetical protein [Actinoplanes teichomyceticus]TWG25264.1 hypothetical protein FHX34_101230 [Actinoplanes teichomyceticus]GIF10334.1 hypothetical protein Ate01nite_03660 [Actinoplanes teichomyceticus]
MSFQDVEPDPEAGPDASVDPGVPPEPGYADHFTGDAVAEAAEPAGAAARRVAPSPGEIRAAAGRVRDAERAIGSVLRGYDFGAGARMRLIQEVSRSAIGLNRLSASLPNLVRPPVLDVRTTALATLAGGATHPVLADVMRLDRMIRDISRAAMPNAASLAVDQFKLFDRITPAASHRSQLSATAGLARAVFPGTGVETWRVSLLTRSNVARLADVRLPGVPPALLGVLAARTDVAAGLAERLAVSIPGAAVDRATARTARAWQRYTALKPTAHRLRMSAAAGSVVGGIIGGDLLLATEDGDAEELAGDIGAQVVEPWHAGTVAARTELHAALRAIDPSIADFLIGAWEDVERKGAAAASKIAHCVVEAVDHTLRALAAPDAAAAWLRRDGRSPAKTDFDGGKPTRRGRIAYALRDRPGDRLLVQNQEAALAGLVAQLQTRA